MSIKDPSKLLDSTKVVESKENAIDQNGSVNLEENKQ